MFLAQAEQGAGWRAWGEVTALTLIAAAVLGYHPYSEDGGIYLAEIKRVLHPELYPYGTEFVSGHLGPSVFTNWTAWIARCTEVQLDVLMLVLHLVCLWGTLFGVWQIAGSCYANPRGRLGAAALVAVCLRIPVAGTSLLLMDPYVTARSAAMAAALLGIAGIADFLGDGRRGRLAWGVAMLLLAAILHPLMGGYAIAEAVLLVCVMSRRGWVRVGGVVSVAAAAAIAADLGQALAAPETGVYLRVAATRYYWFLSEWQWFEIVGLVAPLGILGYAGWKRTNMSLEGGLARMAVCSGGIAIGVAAVFAHESGRVHAVARMQPLRCFLMVYMVMLIVLGGRLGEHILRGSTWKWAVALTLVVVLMAFVQRTTYSNSAYWEVPGRKLENAWEQAFVWVGGNTPNNALFALDADYVQRLGEDGQVFRALAERSALPDYSKDGGQAAIRPELTDAWIAGQRAQTRLTEESDVERLSALRPLGVTWMVIGSEGVTSFACPYANREVRVCSLP